MLRFPIRLRPQIISEWVIHQPLQTAWQHIELLDLYLILRFPIRLRPQIISEWVIHQHLQTAWQLLDS